MYEPHLTDEDVEDFARKALADPALARVEEHLLVCELCRRRVEDIDRFIADLRRATSAPEPSDVIHATLDGPIRLQTRKQKDGTWCAELCGAEIESVGTFATQAEAGAYVTRIFAEMFPEHVCNAGCREGARRIA